MAIISRNDISNGDYFMKVYIDSEGKFHISQLYKIEDVIFIEKYNRFNYTIDINVVNNNLDTILKDIPLFQTFDSDDDINDRPIEDFFDNLIVNEIEKEVDYNRDIFDFMLMGEYDTSCIFKLYRPLTRRDIILEGCSGNKGDITHIPILSNEHNIESVVNIMNNDNFIKVEYKEGRYYLSELFKSDDISYIEYYESFDLGLIYKITPFDLDTLIENLTLSESLEVNDNNIRDFFGIYNFEEIKYQSNYNDDIYDFIEMISGEGDTIYIIKISHPVKEDENNEYIFTQINEHVIELLEHSIERLEEGVDYHCIIDIESVHDNLQRDFNYVPSINNVINLLKSSYKNKDFDEANKALLLLKEVLSKVKEIGSELKNTNNITN